MIKVEKKLNFESEKLRFLAVPARTVSGPLSAPRALVHYGTSALVINKLGPPCSQSRFYNLN